MSREHTAGLMIVHGNRAESLRQLLADWMRRHPLAPLEPECILVQSNGVAQWLRLALAADTGAGGCGIAAALQFSLPSRFQWQAYRAVLGREAVPESSPFDKERLLWRLMRLLPALGSEPVYQPLQRFLATDHDLRKRYQLAERVADLFDQYQVYRADWLGAWADGENVLTDARGGRRPLPAGQEWQAALWRALVADIGGVHGGRAAVHAAFLQAAERAAAGMPAGSLPRRVLVFGISSLPRQSVEVLAAVARWSQVLLCVANPCAYYWADIVGGIDLLRGVDRRQARRSGMPVQLAESELHLHAQPLLAAWGKQGRDFIALLDEYDSAGARGRYAPLFGERIDLFEPHGEGSLLNQLQEDIRTLRPLAETRARWPALLPEKDFSIRFHVAHTPQREVEILHDRLLDAFDADPTLRPRDVIVMVPQIERYAPHIQAVFGLLDGTDPRHIPFTLADQGLRGRDPLLNAVEQLLALPQSRISVSDLLDLLETPALRRRFGIGDEQLPLLQRWVRGANVRWGLHAEQRDRLDLAQSGEQGSWLFGLRRMLLGYAVGDGAAWSGIEPYAEVGGLDAVAAGALAQLLTRLDQTWRILGTKAEPALWCERLRQLLEHFFQAEQGDEAYTLQQLLQALENWRELCDACGLNEPLPLSVVGEQWLAQLDQGGLNQRFFAGAVTFATLLPMRAIPFRLVCLLGMNDGDYPRPRAPLDFDLMAGDYRPGDRSRREDDRYLFLEALLSARERLHISWVGRSVADNTPRPPSVLVGQLRDHLAAGWQLAGRSSPAALLQALTIEHPLQPFSVANFGTGAMPLFSYAREWLAAPAQHSGPVAELAPAARREPLTLAELAGFLRDPVRAFFRQRLQVAFERDELASEDVEPFDLDGMARWQLQQQLIDTLPAQTTAEELAGLCQRELARMQHRGDLPVGAFGAAIADELAEPMASLFTAWQAALTRWPLALTEEEPVALRIERDGASVELTDWIGGLRQGDEGRARVLLEASALVSGDENRGEYRGEVLLRHWALHLAGNLLAPQTTLVLSKRGQVELPPLSTAEATATLTELLDAWWQGMRRPLPLPVRTAFAWLKARPAGDTDAATIERAGIAASRAYEGGFGSDGEVLRNPYLRRCWPRFEALAASGEFTSWAERLLRPLQQAMHALADSRRQQRGGDT